MNETIMFPLLSSKNWAGNRAAIYAEADESISTIRNMRAASCLAIKRGGDSKAVS